MKTMEDYTNYCTEGQTKKAFKLGAPIYCEEIGGASKPYLFIPTTQQMIGWLREKHNLFCGVDIDANERKCGDENNCSYLFYKFNRCGVFVDTIRKSMHIYTYQQAELSAIDVALDYLEKGE